MEAVDRRAARSGALPIAQPKRSREASLHGVAAQAAVLNRDATLRYGRVGVEAVELAAGYAEAVGRDVPGNARRGEAAGHLAGEAGLTAALPSDERHWGRESSGVQRTDRPDLVVVSATFNCLPTEPSRLSRECGSVRNDF
jgi:hypothetical protein